MADDNQHHEAVNKAMKTLKVADAPTASVKIKLNAPDVKLLSAELDLSRDKATDLLRRHNGDVVQALRSYVTV